MTKKHLISAIVFLIVCGILFSGCDTSNSSEDNMADRKEAKYLNSIFEEMNKGADIVKLMNDGNIKNIAKRMDNAKTNIEKLEPPKTISASIKDSQNTLEDGFKKLAIGFRDSDNMEKVEEGQNAIEKAKIRFVNYVTRNNDVKKLIKDRYIEVFISEN
ncbi:hypothetical protein GCM10007063_34900 [Lentibacillus kapialis]|uniref:Lipoprotein n=1 Tax=Lentibacillus kapialis TaxID=340214 RepID=A0A917V1N2_9BACI|nr:hypothetical protein [Lentibacillus kapialis]GGK09445.1 hypothetical protein GCM10007063_34900 [Lentibacillus kapialis]